MLFIQPAVVPVDGPARDNVAEVCTVAKHAREESPRWDNALELAQLQGVQSGGTSNVAPSTAVPGVGGTPPITNPAGGSVPPNPVGAAPPIPGDVGTPTGNTYGTQQEPTGTTGTTAPVTPGVPGPGAGAAGSGGGGLAAPELGKPPAGNIDNNTASPYNSSGGGAGLTGTGMNTTAAPPSGRTTAVPPSAGTTAPSAPLQSGSSGTR